MADAPDSILFSDGPITTRNDDGLGRWDFSYRVARLIAERISEPSIAIGIHAPWGEGKSSVLNMVIEALDKDGFLYRKTENGEESITNGHIVKIDFNPWRFHDEEKLLHSFFVTLAKALDSRLETRSTRMGRFLEKYSNWAAIADTVKVKFAGTEGTGEVSFEPNISETLRKYGELLIDEDVEKLKKRISDLLVDDGRKILIVMDDIDRLNVKELRAVFRLIKLTADFKNTIYLLAFDERRVSKALSKEYGDDKGSGHNFLEKILQVSIPLPPADKQSLFDLTIEGINSAAKTSDVEITDEQAERFGEFFSKAFRERITSPRLAKKFLNSLIFAYPLLKGEADLLDALFVEALKVFYPGFYDTIRDNGDLILEISDSGQRVVQDDNAKRALSESFAEAFKEVPLHRQGGIRALVQDLLPGITVLSAIGNPSTVRSQTNALRDKRLSTSEYFWKYFTYGPSPYDVSDKQIADFLKNIETERTGYVADFISQFLEKRPARFTVLINKVRQFEDELGQVANERLILGLSNISDKFPEQHPDDKRFGVGIRSEVCRLMMHLANRMGSARRDVILKVARKTPSVVFAYDFAIMVRAFGEKLETNDKAIAILCTGIEREVNEIVAARIADEARDVPIYKIHPLEAHDLSIHWFENDATSLSQHALNTIVANPPNAVPFIASMTGRNITGNKKYDSYLHRDMNFVGMIKAIIDPELLRGALKSVYPLIDSTESSEDLEEQLAIAFLKAL